MNGALVRRSVALVGVCLGAWWAMTGSGCLITDPPQVEQAAVEGEASFMCSVCWTHEFCYDPTRPEGSRFYGSPPCDKDADRAVEATRVTDAVGDKEGGFFCWKPFPTAVMAWNEKSCPSDEKGRANVEFLDPCQDAPTCAQPDRCGLHDPPSCPEVSPTARTSTCVPVPDWTGDGSEAESIRGAAAVVRNLVKIGAARHGTGDPPWGAQPERYCYLACVDDCALDGEVPSCLGCEGKTSFTAQSVVRAVPPRRLVPHE